MPFRLKNAGATYQRFMDRLFQNQIGKNLEVYVDDLVIKSKEESRMIADIEETFETLRTANMKLNPGKCSFGVEEGKFFGMVVTKEGIKANPDKVGAVLNMGSPKSLKDVQRLNGSLRKSNFSWTSEAKEAFQAIKKHLGNLPALATLKPDETLTMYLAASSTPISSVLMVDRDYVQTPIYFLSRTLKGPVVRYPVMEKLALALIHASRMLRRYFQAHTVQVLTEKPIQRVLRNQKCQDD
ncbi:hypothetical protein L1987_64126 [Smallanthus sonchifolius]|uniref:Uncharacterized protein n=1 Tax=Smallanthus sonchifolius TaxID=185202 RepID=A0ACB9CF54_9ASTR|nr:hypothetical protein L1987_64126 [Smallanthus sonchifolius]